MRAKWMMVTSIALLLCGCATSQIMPTAEERQALAPTGKLRLAFLGDSAAHAANDPVSGEFRGPAIDIGKELARRVGVPLETVQYPTVKEMVTSTLKGEWDVISIGTNPEREEIMDFGAPYSQIEAGYLVGKNSPISEFSEVDRPGVRIAVLEKGGSDLHLTKTLKHATLIRIKSVPDAVEMLRSGKADVHSNIKTLLFPASEQLPGSRVLEGRTYGANIAIGVPKGREVSARYVRKFIDELKAQGFVKQSIERAGVRGLIAAP